MTGGARRIVGASLVAITLGTACSTGAARLDPAPPGASTAPAATTTAPAETPKAAPSTTPPPAPPNDPAGAGDPYYPRLGNGGYDVARYDVAITANPPESAVITVRTAITATATASLTFFHLDLAGMTVDAITVDGAAAAFRREADELVVTPSLPLAAGVTFVTEIIYRGTPTPVTDAEQTPLGWLRTGTTTYVVSEPNGAHAWLASSDHPSDKASFSYRIDVPTGYTAAANGRLVSADAVNGRTTWVWEAPEPMATYLATVAIGSFTIVDGGSAAGVRIRHVVPTSLTQSVTAALARTGEMIEVLSTMFGPFPFGDYGALVIDARLGYALETQTLSLFDRSIMLSADSQIFQVHELAHQWFGDSVSLNLWRDIWLNEGFATYAESLWRERTDPSFDIDRAMRALATRSYAPIGDPGAAKLFGRDVYDRGALTLHALRRTIGETAFFSLLRAWGAEHARANAATSDFVRLANNISGRDLSPLLDAWLNADPMPTLA